MYGKLIQLCTKVSLTWIMKFGLYIGQMWAGSESLFCLGPARTCFSIWAITTKIRIQIEQILILEARGEKDLQLSWRNQDQIRDNSSSNSVVKVGACEESKIQQWEQKVNKIFYYCLPWKMTILPFLVSINRGVM